MRLEPLYRIEFDHPDAWAAGAAADGLLVANWICPPSATKTFSCVGHAGW